jgi:hypothetical protein
MKNEPVPVANPIGLTTEAESRNKCFAAQFSAGYITNMLGLDLR